MNILSPRKDTPKNQPKIPISVPLMLPSMRNKSMCRTGLRLEKCFLKLHVSWKHAILFLFLIDKSESGQGANSVLSLVKHTIVKYLSIIETNDLLVQADNCSGPNKNNAFLHYLLFLAQKGISNLQTISFLFPDFWSSVPTKRIQSCNHSSVLSKRSIHAMILLWVVRHSEPTWTGLWCFTALMMCFISSF